jgi:hypothetical protein
MNFHKLPFIKLNCRDKTPIKLHSKSFIDKDTETILRINKTPERLITELKDSYKKHNHTFYNISNDDTPTATSSIGNIKQHLKDENVTPIINDYEIFFTDYINTYTSEWDHRLLQSDDNNIINDYKVRRDRRAQEATKNIHNVLDTPKITGKTLYQRKVFSSCNINKKSTKLHYRNLTKPILKITNNNVQVKVNESMNVNINKTRSNTPTFVVRLYTPKKVTFFYLANITAFKKENHLLN